MPIVFQDHITPEQESEIAGLIRRYHKLNAALFKLIREQMEGVSQPGSADFELLNNQAGEAADAVADWLYHHSISHPVLCDGRYYLQMGDELIVVVPEGSIDVSHVPLEPD